MPEVKRTVEFDRWLERLRDPEARARISIRIERLAAGNPGDHRATSAAGIMEMRIAYGPGYRIYYTRRGDVLVILLVGGDKSTQSKDIRHAAAIAAMTED